ncbi:MAG: hypothetical protein U0441_28255 [Polyangiaceae bacterium]
MRSFSMATLVALVSIASAACGGTVQESSGDTGGAGGSTTTTTTDTTTSTDTTTTSDTTTTTTVDIGQPSDVYPAPHQAPPKVVTFGGDVMSAPKIQPIFFSNDDPTYVASVTDFVSKIGPTKYWAAVTAEYGVGPASSLSPVMLDEAATGTITDADVQAWLGGKLNADDPAFAAPDQQTIYTIIYPTGLTINEQGALSCQSFGGYHSNFPLDAAHGNQQVAYAVIPRCPDFGNIHDLDAVTGALSHELIEAATDPFPMTDPAYAQTDNAHIFWVRALGGGETGDMCAQDPESFTKFDEMPYVVQRSWSNAAAKNGNDPCQPTKPGDVYFQATPVMTDSITYGGGGFSATVKGVKIPLGESRTVDLQLFSDGPTDGPITVHADDFSELIGGTKHLDFSFDATQGLNGQTLHMTINVLTAGKKNTELFYLVTEYKGQQNIWIGVVGQ